MTKTDLRDLRSYAERLEVLYRQTDNHEIQVALDLAKLGITNLCEKIENYPARYLFHGLWSNELFADTESFLWVENPSKMSEVVIGYKSGKSALDYWLTLQQERNSLTYTKTYRGYKSGGEIASDITRLKESCGWVLNPSSHISVPPLNQTS